MICNCKTTPSSCHFCHVVIDCTKLKEIGLCFVVFCSLFYDAFSETKLYNVDDRASVFCSLFYDAFSETKLYNVDNKVTSE
jgi:hypothetical protein